MNVKRSVLLLVFVVPVYGSDSTQAKKSPFKEAGKRSLTLPARPKTSRGPLDDKLVRAASFKLEAAAASRLAKKDSEDKKDEGEAPETTSIIVVVSAAKKPETDSLDRELFSPRNKKLS